MVFEPEQEQIRSVVKTPRKSPRQRLKYFYLNGNLHKLLQVSRPRDICIAWDYSEAKRKLYSWSDVQKRSQRAFSIPQAAKILQRHRTRINEYIYKDAIRPPQRVYNLKTGEPGKFMFSEDDMLELHDYLVSLHRGRPRKDGVAFPQATLSRSDLKALMKYDRMIYIKDENGELVPIWQEQLW